MLVTVWTSDGAKHVTLPNSATIADLKEVLVEHLNYDPDQLEISHGGRFVRDEINVARFPPNTLVAEGPRYSDYNQRLWHQQRQQLAAQRQRQREQQNRYVDPRSMHGGPYGRPTVQDDDDDDEDDENDNTFNFTQNNLFDAPRPHGHRQQRHNQQQRNQERLRQQQLLRQQEEQQRLQDEARRSKLLQQQRDRERALKEKEEALKALEARRAAIRRQEEEMRRQQEEIARREQELQRQLEEEARRLQEAEEEQEESEEDEMTRESTVVLHPHLQRVDLDETIHRSRSKQPSPSTSAVSTPVHKPLSGDETASVTPPPTPSPIVPQNINVEVIIPELDDKTHTITIPYDCLVSDVIAEIKELEPEATKAGVRLMFCDKYVRSEKESIRSVPLMDGSKVVACTGKYLSENEMTLYMASSKLKEVRRAVAEHTERPIDRNLKLHWNELLMKALMQLDSLQEVPEDIRLRRKAAVKEVMAEQDVLSELK